MEFKDWFFKQFPDFHQVNDVNKNSLGEGTFQRYLRTFGLELDEEIMPFIHSFMNIVDLAECDDKYLPLVATILGSPPSIGSDNDLYRKLLAYAVAIYKVKGTKKSYEILFGIVGWTIALKMDVPKKKLTYDADPLVIYDEEPDVNQYDQECEYCTNYWIGYYSGSVFPEIIYNDEELKAALQSIICWIQPINAKFQGFIRLIEVTDIYTFPLSDDFDIQIL